MRNLREPTPEERKILDTMVRMYRAKLESMTNGEVDALAFAALMTIGQRHGIGTAAAWALHQAERLDRLAVLDDVEGTA